MERKVIKIEARPVPVPGIEGQIKKRRVTAYARLSTSSAKQLVSFEAQRDYYTQYILAYPNWDFAGIYVDEGIPGVSCKKREGFKRMVKDALEGRTSSNIAAILKAEGVPSPAGKRTWQVSTVRSILANEKYYGAALLQKTYTEDFITKKSHKNNGELPQYYIEKAHKPIVSKEVFDEVQHRLNHPTIDNASHNTFANQLFCGDCGSMYGRKINGSYSNNKKYRYPVWKCNCKYAHVEKCQTPPTLELSLFLCYY